jgi:hypothetical protein
LGKVEVNRKFKVFQPGWSQRAWLRLFPHSLTAAMAVLTVWLLAMEWREVQTSPISLVVPIRTSLSYILLAWTIVAVILLGVYLISSLEETGLLVGASFLSSVPAMWFVPGVLLLSSPSRVLISLGLLLIANSVRVLISRGLSRRDYLPPVRRPRHVRPVSAGRISPVFDRGTATLVLGALAFQAGIAAIWMGDGWTGAVLFGTGAMIWTLAAIARGAYQPRKRVDSVFRAVLTLIWTIAISATQISSGTQAVSDSKLPQLTQLTLHRPPKKSVTRVFTQASVVPPASSMVIEGVEGVILRPRIVRPRLTLGISQKTFSKSSPSPSGFHFTGEYRLFPLASRDLKKDWSVETGTPVDSVYGTISGRPLQTEAYQAFDPPLDFTRLVKLQLTLVSHEGVPAAATVQLIGNRKVQDLGPEIFGLDQKPEETIEFAVPDSLGGLQVTGIRVIFSCIAAECSQSLRVAVQEFRFLQASS